MLSRPITLYTRKHVRQNGTTHEFFGEGLHRALIIEQSNKNEMHEDNKKIEPVAQKFCFCESL